MKARLNKKETEQKINDFFKNIKDKTPFEIKKIKRLAMSKNIKLRDSRKKFCKKCFSADLKTKKITRSLKTIECKSCGFVSRYKLK